MIQAEYISAYYVLCLGLCTSYGSDCFYLIQINRIAIYDLLWWKSEQVASDIWLISDSTKPTVQAIMVSDDQLDQYFQFIKDMLLEVIREPLIHSANINQNLPTIQGLDKVMQFYS